VDPSPALWSVVVPVKRPELAKTRLRTLAGPYRAELARAIAADTVAAATRAREVGEVVAVTDDAVTTEELRALGAVVAADDPGDGLNPALRHGAAVALARRPGAPVATLSADLPALRPDELDVALRAARHHPVSFVADVAGTGTTLYAAVDALRFRPEFGPRSRAAHRAAGAAELDLPGVPSVRRDVDTPVDLWDAIRMGTGPRTARVAGLLPR
jgi:2-phospho-L-lactate/phosphoenolpyruvate guanylyltransferase